MISRLRFKNCLGIEELAFNPGKVNRISGGNEKGKTSILEAIEKALQNTKRRAKFVRQGENEAFIELQTDDGLIVQRNIKEDEAGLDKGSVKVVKDGEPQKQPETYLKRLLGGNGNGHKHDLFSFNPVDFMLRKEAEQTDILLGLLDIRVSADDAKRWFGEAPRFNYEKHGLQVLKDAEKYYYEMRHEANTRVHATEDEISALTKRLPDNYDRDKWEGIKLSDLYAKLHQAEEVNAQIAASREVIEGYEEDLQAIANKYKVQENAARQVKADALESAKRSIEDQKDTMREKVKLIDTEIGRLEREIENLKRRRSVLETEIKNLDDMSLSEKESALDKELQARLEGINNLKAADIAKATEAKTIAENYLATHEIISTAEIKAECDNAETMKSYSRLAQQRADLESRLIGEKTLAYRYNECVEIARVKPGQLLKQAELPIQGLGIDSRGIVTINDLPLSNMSTSKQVTTCLNIAKALCKDSLLKVVCVDKLEHLDETARAEFEKQMGEDQDGFQYFVTVVTDGPLNIEALA